MSKKLHVRRLNRKSLHRGRFQYMICLKRSHWRVRHAVSNKREVAEIRSWLRSACHGNYLIEQDKNRRSEVVYTKIYLKNAMDLAMIKLTHSEKLWRIYQITVEKVELAQ